jgi:hypothetical protein
LTEELIKAGIDVGSFLYAAKWKSLRTYEIHEKKPFAEMTAVLVLA